MKRYYYLLLVAMLYCSMGFVTSCATDDLNTAEQFEKEMDEAMADARKYGPHTQAFAVEIANRYQGLVTEYDKLMTEIQVKTYGMFYASQEESIERGVLGDEIYNFIHTKSGEEPGLSHYYYEIMRADTSSAATVENTSNWPSSITHVSSILKTNAVCQYP